MRNYSKRVRKLIREYAGLAYERELVAELGKLADRVNAWKQGEISPWELNDDIWKYVKGPQREMWKKYTNKDFLDLVVARAITDGFLKREEVPGDVLESIDDLIKLP